MGISLVKGQRVDLTKGNAGLNNIQIGLGWDPAEEQQKKKGMFGGMFGGGASKAANVDCDASVLLLDDDRIRNNKDVIYFGNLKNDNGSISHSGDNVTGEGDGDDEQIHLTLNSIPQNYNKLVFVVNIYDAIGRNQHFGMIKNAYIRILDGNKELIRYNLTDDYTGKMTLVVGELYRHGAEWKFAALGEGTTDGKLGDIVKKYS
ncbi:TerD family protein [Kurthia sibirica]|uniref:Stress protein n=1 Tax=Kurthia sibirica TaxID=202750 RepID=A0A2U3AJS9_9BACL|nr:TerD family protein [Kurthia sibirica]PWI24767.1 stress protein [Kurthia sibirica]GEK35135.1 stress response protein SCP2 [Kurthia sibirica]